MKELKQKQTPKLVFVSKEICIILKKALLLMFPGILSACLCLSDSGFRNPPNSANPQHSPTRGGGLSLSQLRGNAAAVGLMLDSHSHTCWASGSTSGGPQGARKPEELQARLPGAAVSPALRTLAICETNKPPFEVRISRDTILSHPPGDFRAGSRRGS